MCYTYLCVTAIRRSIVGKREAVELEQVVVVCPDHSTYLAAHWRSVSTLYRALACLQNVGAEFLRILVDFLRQALARGNKRLRLGIRPQ